MRVRLLLAGLLVACLCAGGAGAAHAQQGPPTDTLSQGRGAPSPTGPDTTGRPAGRPSGRPGSAPGAGAQAGGAGSNAVQMTAQDSLVITVDSVQGDQATLYGNSEVTYQQATLKAKVIALDLETGVMEATGPPSDSAQGRPVFQQGGGSSGSSAPRGGNGGGLTSGLGGGGGGGQSFTGEVLQYNIRTKRGRVVTARTERSPGYVQGSTVKLYEDSTLFVRDGTYTTCDCPPDQTPSYSLRSNQMKLKDKWVYTGPIQLYLFNVPTPLWLPFGFLPNTSGRRSGPLPPQYGQDEQRGLYLKDWGWYFALNDYTDLQIRAGLYSRGSFWVEPRFRYKKRYEYDGNARLRFERFQTGEEEDPGFTRRYEGSLRWTHRQDINPSSSFNADVDLQTSNDFNRRNSESYEDNVKQRIGSSLSYRKSWPGGKQSLSVSASHDQTLTTGQVSLSLPQLSFSQGSFQPFAADSRIGDERWYEKIRTSYSLNVRNRYQFSPRDPDRLRRNGTPADSTLADSLEQADIQWYEALFDRQKYELATGNDEPYDLEAEHSIPLSASFRINRYNLNVTPNANYRSTWLASTKRLTLRRETVEDDEGNEEVRETRETETVPGFFADRQFSVGVGTSTELFGTFPLSVGPFQGLRHRMRPNVSLSYSPNFNDPFWGNTRVLRDQDGDVVRNDRGDLVRYDIVSGNTVSGSNEQRTVSFGVDNDLETKRVTADTTGETSERSIRLLTFGANSSYNFVAEEFKLGDVRANASTRYEQFNFQTNFTFSPYQFEIDDQGTARRVDGYLATESPWKPLRLTNFSFNMSGSFEGDQTPGRRGSGSAQGTRSGSDRNAQTGAAPSQRRGPGHQHRQGYVDYRIPWSLSFQFNYSLSKPFDRVENRSASINGTVDFRITPKWKVNVRTGYDFLQKELVTTKIDVYRDLGCWEMAFTWVPFGRNQSYGFNLHVKSGRLAQLLRLNIPRSGEGRLGGIGNQIGGAASGAVGGTSGGLGGGGLGGGFQ